VIGKRRVEDSERELEKFMRGRSNRSVSERFGALVNSYWSEVHGGKTPGAVRESEYEGALRSQTKQLLPWVKL
jgi:hypothetical protein